MIKPTFARIKHILYSFDWNGHVELPDSDLTWLAEQLSAHLSASSLEVCDSCGRSMSIVVTTRLGNICSDCLEEATDTADNIRDTLTGGGVDESGATVSVSRGHIQPVPTKVLL
jgi:hypothetical protein